MPKIRVIIIDDSAVFRTFLAQTFGASPNMEVVGSFRDPVEAMAHIRQLNPDVVTVDMEMPKMRGDEFLRNIRSKMPGIKAVVISSLSGNVFDAMQAGAIDFVGKPGSQPGYGREQFMADIVQKVRIAASARLGGATVAVHGKPAAGAAQRPKINLSGASSKNVIAIGASTGGTEAIIEVIKHFPNDTPGVVIVQHMPPVFTKMYAERIDKICPMKVREAQNGDRVETGTVLIAPGGNQQMYLRGDAAGYYVYLAEGAKVSGHCPSVDVLFSSVAKTANRSAVGVLLTGMGADGAKGLCEMRGAGAYTFGQDEASSIVYGMPKVAYDMGGVSEQLPLTSIGEAVLRRFSK